jgi:Ca2+-dependent lipid-binding protein
MAVAPTLASKIELYLEAHNLPSFDVTSKTDAFVVLEMKAPNGSWMPIGKSEVVMNSNSPKFTTQFQLEYRFEENQPIRAVVWDYDELTAHDYIAEVETTIGKIMGSRGSTLNAQLVRRQGRPLSAARTSQMSLVFRASEIKNASNDRVRVQLKAANLAAKDSGFFGIGASSDPYFVISRIMGDGSKLKVYESPRLDKNLNPTWPMFEASIQSLCNNDLSAPLAVDVWDWDAHSSHDLIGSTTLTLQQLLDAPKTSHQWPLIKDKHKSKSGYTNSGLLMVNSIQYVKVPSFLDYLKGGMQLNVVASIDFTGSNGDPRSPSSLHYVNPMGGYNEYLQALTATVPIVLDYDSDKMIAAYGFGGAIGGSTSHCFHLNMNPANPEVAGLEGLVAAYKNSFNYVGLSGPTYFAPIIRQAAKIASSGDNLSQANQVRSSCFPPE